MSTDKSDPALLDPALLDTVARHLERASHRSLHAKIGAHETIDKLIDVARHHGRVAAINEAIADIRKLADTWGGYAREGASILGNDAVIVTLQQHVTALNDLAFRLLSKVDES